MIDLFLPGRESEPEDFEAQSALRTLLESEKLKHCGDEELLSRISDQIRYNQDMLGRVSEIVDGLLTEGEEAPLFADTPTMDERSDTRTIEDFLVRANRARKEEHRRTMQPLQGGRKYG